VKNREGADARGKGGSWKKTGLMKKVGVKRSVKNLLPKGRRKGLSPEESEGQSRLFKAKDGLQERGEEPLT